MNSDRIVTRVHVTILIGLLVSGGMLALALYGGISYMGGLGVLLGWVFGALSLLIYVAGLGWALWRNSVHEFWGGVSPVNFGVTLYAVFLLSAPRDLLLALVGKGILLGVPASVALWYCQATRSRIVIILISCLVFLPIKMGLTSYASGYPLAVATVFIFLPILCTFFDGRRVIKRTE